MSDRAGAPPRCSERPGPDASGPLRLMALLVSAALAITTLAFSASIPVPLAEALIVWFVINALDAAFPLSAIGCHRLGVLGRGRDRAAGRPDRGL
jgi:hypothetical protein